MKSKLTSQNLGLIIIGVKDTTVKCQRQAGFPPDIEKSGFDSSFECSVTAFELHAPSYL